jgi:hypothetical protein
MDAAMEELAEKGQQSPLLLNGLSQHAGLLWNLGNLYNEHHFHKGEYREIDAPKSGFA